MLPMLMSLLAPASVGQRARPATHVSVPFVGCASDGQLGPVAPPRGKSKVVILSADDARQLAYYKAKEGFGVLAPRGWHCFSAYGSNGSTLYVSAERIDGAEWVSGKWKGPPGDAIQISSSYGGTSGRFEVAEVIARVFPMHADFVKNVIAEGIETASDFPTGPYPADKLAYKSNEAVEFETPANSDGLGTILMWKNGEPIRGVAILVGEDTDLVLLSARVSGG
jgi:hypothetical protein